MVDEVVLTVLVENSVGGEGRLREQLVSRHGLSVLVDAKVDGVDVRVVLDSGPSGEVLLNNVDVLDVNLRKVDVAVLSHGHYDHAGGLTALLKAIGKPTMLVAHPKAFNTKLALRKKLHSIGPPFSLFEVEEAGGVPVLATNPVKVAEGIVTSGEVERSVAYEKPLGFCTVDDGRFMEDLVVDDQALVIDVKKKGLVVMSGCAHAGIVNTVLHAQKIMKTKKVYAVFGGFHLIDASNQKIQATVEDLKKLDVEILGACHCTGKKAMRKMEKAFKDKWKPIRTGDTIRL